MNDKLIFTPSINKFTKIIKLALDIRIRGKNSLSSIILSLYLRYILKAPSIGLNWYTRLSCKPPIIPPPPLHFQLYTIPPFFCTTPHFFAKSDFRFIQYRKYYFLAKISAILGKSLSKFFLEIYEKSAKNLKILFEGI